MRRLTFSVRTLALMILLAGAAMACIAKVINNPLQQHQTLVSLGNRVGEVGYEPNIASWIFALAGGDFRGFANYADIYLGGPNIEFEGLPATDDDWSRLERLTSIKELTLHGGSVDDDRLKHLNGLTQLESLKLLNTKVSDEGLARIRSVLPGCKIRRLEGIGCISEY